MLINKHTNLELGSQIGPPPYVSLVKTYSMGTVFALAAAISLYYVIRKQQ